MPRVLWLLIGVLCAVLPLRVAAGERLLDRFEAAAFTADETRLMHAALAALGAFDGTIDGALDAEWDGASDRALVGYVAQAFDDVPANLHAAALVIDFLAEIDEHGWADRSFPELGVSMAVPERALGAPTDEDGGRRWSNADGSLTLLTQRQAQDEALAWHVAARRANADPAALGAVDGAAVRISAGRLDDGRRFFTRSDRMPGHWATVLVAAREDDAALLSMMRASLRPGAPLGWELPAGGRLDRLVRETLALAGRLEVKPSPPVPDGVRLRDADDLPASGTGFYVSDRVLVTARHVIGDCAAVGLADGTQLTLIAEDAGLDVAVLAAPDPAAAWLPLLPAWPARLGQRVHAMGYPYYHIAGTSLHLTGGNVSALAGVDDDGRFFSFTAPVQPGSSGGPLIGPRGAVLGVVVSRLSDRYIAETTGTLPQNVNYALKQAELVGFLARSGVAPKAGNAAGFDLDAEGVPRSVEAAVVPVLCL